MPLQAAGAEARWWVLCASARAEPLNMTTSPGASGPGVCVTALNGVPLSRGRVCTPCSPIVCCTVPVSASPGNCRGERDRDARGADISRLPVGAPFAILQIDQRERRVAVADGRQHSRSLSGAGM